MKKTIPLLMTTACTLLTGLEAAHAGTGSDLFISQYIEGSSYNKALEIYNPTNAPVSLTDYTLNIFTNGADTARYSITLEGMIEPGKTITICHPDADQAITSKADSTSSSINFNGDDAITLAKNEDIIDSIGQIGVDPGSEWEATKDNTLVRKASITAGDTDAYNEFVPGDEWEILDNNDFTGLGSHLSDGNSNDGDNNPPTDAEFVFIHNVQGDGEESPLKDTVVTIEGVVTADFQKDDQLSGFYIQEEAADADTNDNTSEGIFVYHSSTDVNVGDIVQLTGTVAEYYSNTQIKSVTNITVTATNVELPEMPSITLPFAEGSFPERYEGMLVSFPQPLTVSENYNLGRYGELVLSNGRLFNPTNVVKPGADAIAYQAKNDLNRIILDDGSTKQNPEVIPYPSPELNAENSVRAGDSVTNLTGVLGYSFSSYRIHPTQPVEFSSTNPRTDKPESVGGRLKVASFNVLNYFTTIDQGQSPYPGGSRGADSDEELIRQQNKIVNAMLAVDADIFGLMEMENDSENVALQNLVEKLNEQAGSNTYGYINTRQIGDDSIRVALIHKISTVSPYGNFAILTSDVDPTFLDTRNRPSLAQTFVEHETGEKLTVVVNHLKSKGSGYDDDPDTGDGQGNCNLTRTAAAQAIVDWLKTDPTKSNDSDYLVLGDMNAYSMEDPIRTFIDNGYANVRDQFEANSYSYVYKGQAGDLDHALSNSSMTPQITGVTTWHVNADEPKILDYNTEYKSANQLQKLYAEGPYRASDHDPVIIGVDLKTASTPGDNSSEVTSYLGNNSHQFLPDQDVFTFYADKDEKVQFGLQLKQNNQIRRRSAKVQLTLVDQNNRVLLHKVTGRTKSMRKRLPQKGKYFLIVTETVTANERRSYNGEYTLTLKSQSGGTLKKTEFVE